jgi:hypothetical protein
MSILVVCQYVTKLIQANKLLVQRNVTAPYHIFPDHAWLSNKLHRNKKYNHGRSPEKEVQGRSGTELKNEVNGNN